MRLPPLRRALLTCVGSRTRLVWPGVVWRRGGGTVPDEAPRAARARRARVQGLGAAAHEVAGWRAARLGERGPGGHLATSPRMVGSVVGRGSWSGLGPQHACVSRGVGAASPRRSQMTRRCLQLVVAVAEGGSPPRAVARV